MTLLRILNSYHRLPDKVRKTLETAVLSVVVLLALLWVVAAIAFGRYYVATFVAGFSLTLAVTCYVLAKGRSVRHKVGALLGIYIGLIGFFGSAHYMLFLRNPNLYAFSEVIEEGKVLEEYDDTYKEVLDRNKALFVLAQAHIMIDKVLIAHQHKVYFINPVREQIESEDGFVSLDSSSRIRFRQDQLQGAHSVSHVYWLDLRSRDDFSFSVGGDVVAVVVIPTSRAAFHMHSADSPEKLRSTLEQLIEALRDERETLLAKVRAHVGERPEWNILDFVYYSTVTLTTLGYGDIVPNSSLARFIVLLNSIAGVFFVAYALVALWSGGGSGAP